MPRRPMYAARIRWPARKRKRTDPNPTELALGDRLALEALAGEWTWTAFQGLRFRIGPGVFYTPDWCALHRDGTLTAFEVKARRAKARKQADTGSTEAARVRIHVAAGLYPWVRFVLAIRERGRGAGFTLTDVDPGSARALGARTATTCTDGTSQNSGE